MLCCFACFCNAANAVSNTFLFNQLLYPQSQCQANMHKHPFIDQHRPQARHQHRRRRSRTNTFIFFVIVQRCGSPTVSSNHDNVWVCGYTMATKQTKFGTYLGPPEIEVKQSQPEAKFLQLCDFSYHLEQNCLDRFNVRPVICVAKILHAACSIPNDAKQYGTANESQFACNREFACKREPVVFSYDCTYFATVVGREWFRILTYILPFPFRIVLPNCWPVPPVPSRFPMQQIRIALNCPGADSESHRRA